jgi:serine/threonine protein kinase
MFVCPECGFSLAAPGFCTEHGAALVGSDDPLLGQTLGSFRVARRIGKGGMGAVYLGVHPGIGSRVAIKVLTPESSASRSLVERFFAEARAVNVIRNENIVNVLDLAALSDGRPYIVMEHLEGAPLSALFDQHGLLPFGWLCRLAGDVLAALDAAHSHGIVHRDLKPDNVFITNGGRAKVLDFGIAKLKRELAVGSVETRTGSLLGTPHYMSPEQARGIAVDARSDLYSLGVILFEGAAGRRPFEATTLYDLLRLHVEEPAPPLGSLRPDAPPAFAHVVARALAKSPDERYQTAQEFADALADASRNLPSDSWTAPSLPSPGMARTLRATPLSPGLGPVPPTPNPFLAQTPAPTLNATTAERQEPPRARSGAFVAGALAVIGIFAVLAVAAATAAGGLYYFRTARGAPASSATARESAAQSSTASPATAVRVGFAGGYTISSATNPGKTTGYTGAVSISEKNGAYPVEWSLANSESFSGIGIKSKGNLGVGWSTGGIAGVVVYTVDGGKLSGRWTTTGVTGFGNEDLDGPRGLDGTYRVQGQNPNSSDTYRGTVRIKPQGALYALSWSVGGGSYSGVGILEGDQLVVGWGGPNTGVMLYGPSSGGLSGRWAAQNDRSLGSETLLRR